MQNQEFWQTILSELEVLISKANFITWFKNTSVKERTQDMVVISVPNGFTKEWLANKYHKLILKAIQKFYPEVRKLEYVIGENISYQNIHTTAHTEINTQNTSNLNPLYNFENFVTGPSNELAQATCLSVASNPGKTYNPVFVYGGVGLGKTHLLQAVGNKIIQNQKNGKVCYISSEKFTNELIEALRNHTMKQFKDRYRDFSCLIIDDIQFIAGKEKTQEEFFHTFNSLYEENKQIVLSSDRPPKAIHTLEERLRSRFEGGIIADISYPEYETRLAILQNKLKEKNFNMDENIIEFIATNIKDNVRELEGALNRIIAYSEINNVVPNLEGVNKILSTFTKQPKIEKTNVKQIIKIISKFYNVRPVDIIKKNRQREVVKARQVAMYLLRKELNSSYPYIGERIGGRDHTTAIYAYNKISKSISTNQSLREEIDLIKQQLSY